MSSSKDVSLGDESPDMLATLLCSANKEQLRGAFLGLIDTLRRTNIRGKEEIVERWEAVVKDGECHPIAVRFYILMALINPCFSSFVEYLCTHGDRDRVVTFRRWVDIASAKLFSGVDAEFRHQRMPSAREYPCVGVFVLDAITTYASQWDPHGWRYYRKL